VTGKDETCYAKPTRTPVRAWLNGEEVEPTPEYLSRLTTVQKARLVVEFSDGLKCRPFRFASTPDAGGWNG